MHRDWSIRFVQILCATLFLGRGWQALYWSIPVDELLENELLIGWLPRLMGQSWDQYMRYSTELVNQVSNTLGLFWLSMAVYVLFLFKLPKRLYKLLLWASVSFVLLAVLYWLQHFLIVAQMLEYSIQIITPWLLYQLAKGKSHMQVQTPVKIAVAITFTAHGFYAMGIYPSPGEWLQWIMNVTGSTENYAVNMLFAAGLLDVVAAIALFWRRSQKWALVYMSVWGLSTALARTIAYSLYYTDMPLLTLLQAQWHETMMRIVNGGLPLYLLLFLAMAKPQPSHESYTH
jgi:hypothetical protein